MEEQESKILTAEDWQDLERRIAALLNPPEPKLPRGRKLLYTGLGMVLAATLGWHFQVYDIVRNLGTQGTELEVIIPSSSDRREAAPTAPSAPEGREPEAIISSPTVVKPKRELYKDNDVVITEPREQPIQPPKAQEYVELCWEKLVRREYEILRELYAPANPSKECLFFIKDGHLTGLYLPWFLEPTTLPESICELTELRGINFRMGRLRSLPDCIGNLKNLETLKVPGNQLYAVPESIGELTNLKELHLGGNNLTSLPDSIGNLKNLRYLFLEWNNITTLPGSIEELTQLRSLHVYKNNLPSHHPSLQRLRETGVTVDQ